MVPMLLVLYGLVLAKLIIVGYRIVKSKSRLVTSLVEMMLLSSLICIVYVDKQTPDHAFRVAAQVTTCLDLALLPIVVLRWKS